MPVAPLSNETPDHQKHPRKTPEKYEKTGARIENGPFKGKGASWYVVLCVLCFWCLSVCVREWLFSVAFVCVSSVFSGCFLSLSLWLSFSLFSLFCYPSCSSPSFLSLSLFSLFPGLKQTNASNDKKNKKMLQKLGSIGYASQILGSIGHASLIFTIGGAAMTRPRRVRYNYWKKIYGKPIETY